MIAIPNWCENELNICGEHKDIKKFKEFARTEYKNEDGKIEINVLTTEKFIPYPTKFKKKDEKSENKLATDGFNSGGYEWCIENWGTKWGICSAEITDELESELAYFFESAWAPPTPVILEMSRKFPTLSFELRYFEQGVGFNGIFVAENGEVLKDIEAEYFGNRGG